MLLLLDCYCSLAQFWLSVVWLQLSQSALSLNKEICRSILLNLESRTVEEGT